jgi:hypothetical protein
MNPSHKQNPNKDIDTPQWYIDAHNNSLRYGIGIIAIYDGEEAECINPEDYAELIKFLEIKMFQNSANE